MMTMYHTVGYTVYSAFTTIHFLGFESVNYISILLLAHLFSALFPPGPQSVNCHYRQWLYGNVCWSQHAALSI